MNTQSARFIARIGPNVQNLHSVVLCFLNGCGYNCDVLAVVCTLRLYCAQAREVKRVVGLYDDGSIKPLSATEGLEADYERRCCSANCQAVCGLA